MNKQHTPGPWAVDDSPNRHHFIVAEHRAEICRMGSENMLADDSSAAANARLIAAAPDLLAALREAFAAHSHDGYGPIWSDSIIAKAREAIAAATREDA